MESNSIVEQVRDLINKIKKQDIALGLYIEDHIIFNEEEDTVLYLSKEAFRQESLL